MLAAIYLAAAIALAAGLLDVGPAFRWGLAALSLLLAGSQLALALRLSARTEVTDAGLALHCPPRRPVVHRWEEIERFDAVAAHEDPDAAARMGRRVRMRLRGGGEVRLPGIAGDEADGVAAELSARLRG